MVQSIAIVGMSCQYPDARTPSELWENVLSQRRSFRRMPPERLRLEDYFSSDRTLPDTIYSNQAAVIEGFEFDRVKFKISGSTFRSADLTHWLALDTAAKTFENAGFAEQLPKEMTGVFLGNTLTGEFSRAATLRLRFPYVRRTVEAVLREQNIATEQIPHIFARLEELYKKPFAAIGEESLAGGLSNTIAGRICNYFDLKGGGFTIDGACSSSLLAVSNACSALISGDVDVALAGGVDLSLDPFELVGFAKTGALATEEMRVYDARSNGFFPGEGCGFVLLMREEDAVREKKQIYALIKGWGISSDGSGGITRPTVEGQMLALKRAYARAKVAPESVAYFEGHGTGTIVGDATELKALNGIRRNAVEAAVISSVKTLIGHTKAAAGIAGLIKAVMALKTEILPPMTSCETPHNEMGTALRVLKEGEIWSDRLPLRAGVSSMGFGGINTHIVLEREREFPRAKLTNKEKTLCSTAQDAELFLVSGQTQAELLEKLEHLASFAGRLSHAELTDLAAHLSRTPSGGKYRGAIVASKPSELENSLQSLIEKIYSGAAQIIEDKIFFGIAEKAPRIGFLFSGQGSPINIDGGLWRRRFETVRKIYADASFRDKGETVQTSVVQPALAAACASALQILDKFDVTAQIGVGHSLGELTALHWAGVYDAETLLRITEIRGRAMTETCEKNGAMLSVSADKETIEALLKDNEKVVIAALNAPRQTVVSGEAEAVGQFQNHLRNKNIAAVKLPVSHAFHSPLLSKSVELLNESLQKEDFQSLKNTIISTVTGETLATGENLREVLCRQITSPVLFTGAIEKAEKTGVDLWIEIGTGEILRGLVEQFSQTPVFSVKASSQTLTGLFQAVGAAYALGQEINQEALFAERFTRPFDLDWQPKFFVNPCELAPLSQETVPRVLEIEKPENVEIISNIEELKAEETILTPLELITKLVAERAELPIEAVHAKSRMLSDLHLNSITVGQIVTSAAKLLGAPPPLAPTDYADAAVNEIAESLEKMKNLKDNGNFTENTDFLSGLDTWVRPFKTELIESDLPITKVREGVGNWQVFSSSDYLLTDEIRRAVSSLDGTGVIVCVRSEDDAALLLEGAKNVLQIGGDNFVVVQHEKSFAGFARSFALEHPEIFMRVITLPPTAASVEWLLREISAGGENYAEASYDERGKRFAPVARPIEVKAEKAEIGLTADDVLVATGGAKGITAECVLALARQTGVKLALFGTSDSDIDREIKNNLERFRASGVDCVYHSVDVTDAEAVAAAVKKVEAQLGKITAILHAAAKNEPQLVAQSETGKLQKTIAVKLDGAKNLAAAVDPEQLKFFITFGSIIARTGLAGESDYGLANELLSQFTEDFQAANPKCRCLAFEWSVWAGIGMGTRIADLDMLIRRGISPIPVEKGVKTFLELLASVDLPTSFVVMSRFCDVPAFPIERAELPFQRFLEQPRIYFPKTELIVDVELSTVNDLYLADHQVGGEKLFPAVLGLEAMSQISAALFETEKTPMFKNVSFSRSIVVPENKPLKIRILALRRDAEMIEVAIRSAETDFQIDHFHGFCSFSETKQTSDYKLNGHADSLVEIDPAKDLYGKILFHGERFQRLNKYKHLKARECLAEITADGETRWFSQYLPKKVLLGDPATRDTAIHAIQACLPHATLLPIGVENISIFESQAAAPSLIHAKECSQHENIFTYDLELLDEQGNIFEVWKNLRLQLVNGTNFKDAWIEPLLAVYLERKVAEILENPEISVMLERKTPDLSRRERSLTAMQSALGEKIPIVYRSDGKPETLNGKFVSASHADTLALAVGAPNCVTCDIEPVVERSEEDWANLLGAEGMKLAKKLSHELAESFQYSATRVWTLKECLQKAEIGARETPVFSSMTGDGWVKFEYRNFRLASSVVRIQNAESEMVCSFLSEKI